MKKYVALNDVTVVVRQGAIIELDLNTYTRCKKHFAEVTEDKQISEMANSLIEAKKEIAKLQEKLEKFQEVPDLGTEEIKIEETASDPKTENEKIDGVETETKNSKKKGAK